MKKQPWCMVDGATVTMKQLWHYAYRLSPSSISWRVTILESCKKTADYRKQLCDGSIKTAKGDFNCTVKSAVTDKALSLMMPVNMAKILQP